ncbi:hypothetical protein N0V83_008601 [Neocucurbitaria cava]|uniref:Uncharacterized protein n=1 Tax=Neocucurbitaria cava TaxID=798079 RepID=A0A9W8Y0Q9_9PLEO|nr:hypothetical protein N0V83_008601 [Neocucurbitaria cava]
MIAARPTTEPTTAPAIVPGEALLEDELAAPAVAALALVDEEPADDEDEDAWILEAEPELARDEDEDATGAAHPSVGKLFANPSIGCAYACAPELVATHGSTSVFPTLSYLRAVIVLDTLEGQTKGLRTGTIDEPTAPDETDV